MYAQGCSYAHTHTCKHAHSPKHAYPLKHACKHTYALTHACMHMHVYSWMHANTCTHTHTYTHKYTWYWIISDVAFILHRRFQGTLVIHKHILFNITFVGIDTICFRVFGPSLFSFVFCWCLKIMLSLELSSTRLGFYTLIEPVIPQKGIWLCHWIVTGYSMNLPMLIGFLDSQNAKFDVCELLL